LRKTSLKEEGGDNRFREKSLVKRDGRFARTAPPARTPRDGYAVAEGEEIEFFVSGNFETLLLAMAMRSERERTVFFIKERRGRNRVNPR